MKAYTPFTIEQFKGLRLTDVLNNAALDDNESSDLSNFNITDNGSLTKRSGFIARNTNITASGASPTTIDILAIQNLLPMGGLNRIWFTNQAKTNLWRADLPNITNVTRVLDGGGGVMAGIECMIGAATPAFPYQMQVFRTTGASMWGIDKDGVATVPVSCPRGTQATLFKNRVFLVNSIAVDGTESRVNYSDINNFGSWPGANNFDVAVGDGQFMVATVVFNDTLIMFKNRSTYVLTADGLPTNWVVRNLNPTVGCVGRGTVQVINGFVYFMSQDGVYRTDGTTFERISEPVDLRLRNYNTLLSVEVLSRNAYFYDDKYILVLPQPSQVTAKSPLVYDVRNEVWTSWTVANNIDMGKCAVYQETSPGRLYLGDRAKNAIYSMGDPLFQDDGVDYVASWRSKRFSGGDPTQLKRNYMFQMDVGYTTTEPELIEATHSKDTVDTAQPHNATIIGTTDVTAWDLSRKQLKFAGAGYHRQMATHVQYIGPRKLDIFSMSWLNSIKNPIPRSN